MGTLVNIRDIKPGDIIGIRVKGQDTPELRLVHVGVNSPFILWGKNNAHTSLTKFADPDGMSDKIIRETRNVMTAEEATKLGYDIDRHCYPWVAYKGSRFDPIEVHHIFTSMEAALIRALKAEGQ